MWGADPLLLLEAWAALLLHLRRMKETGTILGQIVAPRVQTDLRMMNHQGPVVLRPQRSIIGGIDHGEDQAATILTIVVVVTVSAF